MTLARRYAICCSGCYAHTVWRGTSKEARKDARSHGWVRKLEGHRRYDYCPGCVDRPRDKLPVRGIRRGL